MSIKCLLVFANVALYEILLWLKLSYFRVGRSSIWYNFLSISAGKSRFYEFASSFSIFDLKLMRLDSLKLIWLDGLSIQRGVKFNSCRIHFNWSFYLFLQPSYDWLLSVYFFFSLADETFDESLSCSNGVFKFLKFDYLFFNFTLVPFCFFLQLLSFLFILLHFTLQLLERFF